VEWLVKYIRGLRGQITVCVVSHDYDFNTQARARPSSWTRHYLSIVSQGCLVPGYIAMERRGTGRAHRTPSPRARAQVLTDICHMCDSKIEYHAGGFQSFQDAHPEIVAALPSPDKTIEAAAGGSKVRSLIEPHRLYGVLIFILVFVTHVHTTNIPCLQTSSLQRRTLVWCTKTEAAAPKKPLKTSAMERLLAAKEAAPQRRAAEAETFRLKIDCIDVADAAITIRTSHPGARPPVVGCYGLDQALL
jgi:hypothetical protein